MVEFNGLLMRDTVSDTGTVPSPGYPYYSPDMICHAQVADPASYFASNYSSDPNQAVQLGSHVNFIYVRAKNLATTTLSGYSIMLYRANASLFMDPSRWKTNRVSTYAGNPYVPLDAVAPNAVTVGTDHFVLDAVTSNLFCLIGIAADNTDPPIPDSFSNYSAYIAWVRQSQNVCGRNLSYAQSFPDRQYERIDSFSNPETEAVPVLFKVSATGQLPAGTTFGVTCAPLHVATSWDINDGGTRTTSAMCPAEFEGTVTTWGTLPAGTTRWPDGARLDVTVYVGRDSEDPVAMWATDFIELGVQPHEVEGLPADGVLVRLGNCATEFVTQ